MPSNVLRALVIPRLKLGHKNLKVFFFPEQPSKHALVDRYPRVIHLVHMQSPLTSSIPSHFEVVLPQKLELGLLLGAWARRLCIPPQAIKERGQSHHRAPTSTSVPSYCIAREIQHHNGSGPAPASAR